MLSPKLLIKEAIEEIMGLVGKANKYVEESAPWEYAKKNDTGTIKLIVADLLEVLRVTAIGLYPFMPDTARKMWLQLGLSGDICEERLTERKNFPAGVKTAKGNPLFPRIQ